jgi:acylphosphatase
MNSVFFIIRGKVQGVFFRATTKTKAKELGIKGWVRNTEAGDVEVLAQGDAEQLALFEDWCRKGPSQARVDSFDREERNSEPCDSFTIVREED